MRNMIGLETGITGSLYLKAEPFRVNWILKMEFLQLGLVPLL